MTLLANHLRARLATALSLGVILCALGVHGAIETGGVYGEWGVWSDWYWPYSSSAPPNMYGANEAMARYDAFAGASSQLWESQNHGPSQGAVTWVGHCHAWAGASVWESLPLTNRVCGGVTFRPRDQTALMIECYFNDTFDKEIDLFRPTPGLMWFYLRQEILGNNALHGHAMGLIGNLTQTEGQIWNFPIYQYEVAYTPDASGSTCSGTITLWFADDGNPSYADPTGLVSAKLAYAFSAVTLGADGVPLDSGNWGGNDPALYPTSLWRPYCAGYWTNYAGNPRLDETHLSQVLGGVPFQCSNTIATSASPLGGGSVSPGGLVNCRSNVTLCATPSAGYSFTHWTENGALVSSNSCYSFTALTSRSLVANFTPTTPLLAVARVASQIVLRWGTNWPGYQLEYCTNAQTPHSWTTATPAPALTGNLYSVTNSVAGASRFYRLRHP